MSDASKGGGWLGAVGKLVHAVEGVVDGAKEAVGRHVDKRRPARIVAYRGYGTKERAWVTGRVLRDLPLPTSREDATLWENALSTWRRFESDEVPNALVKLKAGEVETTVCCDEEGFFDAWVPTAGTAPLGAHWHAVEATLVHPRDDESPAGPTILPVLVPPDEAPLGIISDIDDTVVQTGVKEFLTMARTVFLSNARTRLPFEGVAELYTALQAGATGAAGNPIFYVSSSPWNFYELLVEFFELQKIPLGPVMLRDWGVTADELLPTGHSNHKRHAIDRILATYPARPFLLIGDSGQEDPEIYAQVMRDFPGRIVAAYIRSVDKAETRIAAIRHLAQETARTGGVLILADDTAAVFRDARERGWIR